MKSTTHLDKSRNICEELQFCRYAKNRHPQFHNSVNDENTEITHNSGKFLLRMATIVKRKFIIIVFDFWGKYLCYLQKKKYNDIYI